MKLNKDYHIKKTLQQGELEPDSALWGKLEHKLEVQNRDVKIRRLKRQRLLLAACAACLLVMVTFLSPSFFNTITQSQNIATHVDTPSHLFSVENVREINKLYESK